jgi:hypothetical protein
MKKLLLCLALYLSLNHVQAQVGGQGIYRFLNLHPSARVAALGGTHISVVDNDINLALQNPSLLNSSMHKQATFNTVNYFSDISSGYIAYAHHADSLKTTFSAGLQYINYGVFQGATAQGVPTGTFRAGDYNLHVSAARQWGKYFRYGAALKFIYSTYEQYTSLGIATDVAVTYHNEEKLFTAALVARNLGYQLTTYNGTRENLPFEVQLGLSKKLKHMPMRFSLVAHNLQKFDLTYNNPNRPGQQIDLETGLPVEEKITFGDKVMRHMIIGGELLLSKNFNIRFGYNHLRRKEMTIEGKRGLVGFAWGFGLRLNRFHVSYGSSSFYVGQNTNHFSITTNLNSFKRKNKTKVVDRNSI